MRAITLVPGTVVILSLDGTLVYVEDVQPTGARVVALPQQPPERKETAVFQPGRVGSKVISPYSDADKTIAVTDLSGRNRDFIATYETLRKQHGPAHIARTPEEEAALSVTKAKPSPVHHAPRAKKTPEDRKARRDRNKAAKVPCTHCGKPPAAHLDNSCVYAAPARKSRAKKEEVTEDPTGGTFRMVNTDISALQAENPKFAQGNRYFRVFLVLKQMGTATLAQIIGALAQDAGKPMTDPEKVSRRALRALKAGGYVD